MPIRERSGKWHYRFVVDGQEHTASTGLAADKRNAGRALKKEAEARQLVEEGKAHLIKIKSQPFSKAVDEYLKWAKGEHADSPATYADARSKTAAAKVFFGAQPVHTITAGQLENFKTWRRAGAADIDPVEEVTIRHNLHQLSKFFRWATKHGWTRQNPVDDVDIPSDADAVRMHVLTAQEEASYFKAALELSEVLHDTGRLMLQQGMRPAECTAIQKEDVDLLNRRLVIRGRETRKGKRRTKTAAGTRVLPLTQESMSICAKWITRDPQSRWLFTSRLLPGECIRRTNKAHGIALDACKLDFVLYDFRHTFATRAAAAGVPLMTLAKLLGHANLKTIHRYVHPQDDHLAEAMRMVEAASGICPDRTGPEGEIQGSAGKPERKEISLTERKTNDLQDSGWRRGSGSNRRVRVLQTLDTKPDPSSFQ